MYTADVYSTERWDQTNSPPQIVPLNSNNKKGPDRLVLDLATPEVCKAELTYTEVVYPPKDGHPSQH